MKKLILFTIFLSSLTLWTNTLFAMCDRPPQTICEENKY
jgi:hypothetical protein